VFRQDSGFSRTSFLYCTATPLSMGRTSRCTRQADGEDIPSLSYHFGHYSCLQNLAYYRDCTIRAPEAGHTRAFSRCSQHSNLPRRGSGVDALNLRTTKGVAHPAALLATARAADRCLRYRSPESMAPGARLPLIACSDVQPAGSSRHKDCLSDGGTRHPCPLSPRLPPSEKREGTMGDGRTEGKKRTWPSWTLYAPVTVPALCFADPAMFLFDEESTHALSGIPHNGRGQRVQAGSGLVVYPSTGGSHVFSLSRKAASGRLP